MEVILEVLLESGILVNAIVLGIGLFLGAYVKDTKHEEVYQHTIALIRKILKTYDVPVPQLLEELVERLHDEDIESIKEESVLLDEINKEKKEEVGN